MVKITVRGAGSERRKELRAVRREIEKFREEHHAEAVAARQRFLEETIKRLLERLRDNKNQYVEFARAGKECECLLLVDEAEQLSHMIGQNKRELMSLQSDNQNSITDDMIARAKDYPLDGIININARGFARCINHDEQTPSMFCRNNFAHCFGCGWTGDAIDVFEKVNGCSFPEAVRRMQ